jgi:hypothetical protein
VTRGVELIDRADQPHAEIALDLRRFAGLQEPVETFEDLDVLSPRRTRPPGHRQLTHHPVDVLRGHLPRRAAERHQRPFQQPGVVVDGHRAEAAGPPGGHERLDAGGLEPVGIPRRLPVRNRTAVEQLKVRHPHTFFAPEDSR